MRKKIIIVFACIMMLMAAYQVGAYAGSPIKIVVNGKELRPDVPAQIIDGRTMVPIRFVAEALGANVSWDEYTRTVFINSQSVQPIAQPPTLQHSFSDATYMNNLFETTRLISDNLNLCTKWLNMGYYLTEGDKYNLDIKDREIVEKMKTLSNPPDKYKKLYDSFFNYYLVYKEILQFAKYPPSNPYEYNRLASELYTKRNRAANEFISIYQVTNQ